MEKYQQLITELTTTQNELLAIVLDKLTSIEDTQRETILTLQQITSELKLKADQYPPD
jgi:hypothetical protein